MRGGVILIVVALIVGYMGVTGKYRCFTNMLSCLVSGRPCDCASSGAGGAVAGGAFGTLIPRVAPLNPISPLESYKTPPFAG